MNKSLLRAALAFPFAALPLLASTAARAGGRDYEPGYQELTLAVACKDDTGDMLLEETWAVPLQEDALPAGAIDDVVALLTLRIQQSPRPAHEQDDLIALTEKTFGSVETALGTAMSAYPDRLGVTDLGACGVQQPVRVELIDLDLEQSTSVDAVEQCAGGEIDAWYDIDLASILGEEPAYLEGSKLTPWLWASEDAFVGSLGLNLSASAEAMTVSLTCSIETTTTFHLL